MDGTDSADFADGGTGSKKIIRTIPASDLVAQNQMISSQPVAAGGSGQHQGATGAAIEGIINDYEF
jgi:hypothetical protein